MSKRGLAYLMKRRYPALIAADMASSIIPKATKEALSETLKKPLFPGLSNKLREALGVEPHYVMNADGSLSMTGAGPFQLLKREVKNPGSGSGMPGVGTGGGAGLSEKGLRLAEQRSYVNKKLKEIYDEAPIDPETNLPMLNANWFSSKETIEKIYKSNPKLFPEWKDGIGSWNDLGSGFLAGKFKKAEGPVKKHNVEPVYFDIELNKNKKFNFDLPSTHNSFIYLIDGEIKIGNQQHQKVENSKLILLEKGDKLKVYGLTDAKFLLIAGKPIGEQIARGGPFVMNTKQEILQAVEDYHKGTFVK